MIISKNFLLIIYSFTVLLLNVQSQPGGQFLNRNAAPSPFQPSSLLIGQQASWAPVTMREVLNSGALAPPLPSNFPPPRWVMVSQQPQGQMSQVNRPQPLQNTPADVLDVISDEDIIKIYKVVRQIKKQNGSRRSKNNGQKTVRLAPISPPMTANDSGKCNNETMRFLIRKHMDANPAVAKRQIQAALLDKFNTGHLDVICSSSSFSYLVNTDLYCEVETADLTCLVFRQAS